MQNQMTVRGVPHSLALDGWWLNCTNPTDHDPDQHLHNDPIGAANGTSDWIKTPIAWLLILILLADFLFWQYNLGISIALYAVAIFGFATQNTSFKSREKPALLLAFGALPLVEYVQTMSFLFLAFALLAAIIWAHRPNIDIAKHISSVCRLLLSIPTSGVKPLISLVRPKRTKLHMPKSNVVKTFLRNWAFPLGGSLVFLSFLMDANPVFANLVSFNIDLGSLLGRAFFWAGFGLLVWPLINMVKIDDRGFSTPISATRLPNFGLNSASVLRALIMFNILIGLQTYLDLTIFVGGAELPDGITYATFARRGAYPLVATALLAGAFAIAARPFLGENRFLKPLLLLWLAQNVALCASAGLRLDMYIDMFGLTYLRVRAFIWMAVVAAGLSLTAWQIFKAHSNRWLILRCISLGVGVLYVGSFVNFAAIIATSNITHQKGTRASICALGPMAHLAIIDATKATTEIAAPASSEAEDIVEDSAQDTTRRTRVSPPNLCGPTHDNIDGWRDWGLRKWRTQIPQ